jgi:hypothetical protein
MPWYKIDLNYGPGSQGHDTTYKWFPKAIGEESEHELGFEAIQANPYASDSDQASFHVTTVVALPKEVRQEEIKRYRSKRDYADMMLKVLGEPTK